MQEFSRGAGIAVRQIQDKKLKGTLRRTEKITNNAAKEAKKVYEWLRPADAGTLEAEGVEKTWQFQQRDIVQVCAQATKVQRNCNRRGLLLTRTTAKELQAACLFTACW